jgi:hypothetical protein
MLPARKRLACPLDVSQMSTSIIAERGSRASTRSAALSIQLPPARSLTNRFGLNESREARESGGQRDLDRATPLVAA